MSRFEEYLKTPNPLNPLTSLYPDRQSCFQPIFFPDNTPHSSLNNDVQVDNDIDETYFQKVNKSGKEFPKIIKTIANKPFLPNDNSIIEKMLRFDEMSEEMVDTPINTQHKQ
jgi:hypothetical protein